MGIKARRIDPSNLLKVTVETSRYIRNRTHRVYNLTYRALSYRNFLWTRSLTGNYQRTHLEFHYIHSVHKKHSPNTKTCHEIIQD